MRVGTCCVVHCCALLCTVDQRSNLPCVRHCKAVQRGFGEVIGVLVAIKSKAKQYPLKHIAMCHCGAVEREGFGEVTRVLLGDNSILV